MSNQKSNLPTHIAFLLTDEQISFEVILRAFIETSGRFSIRREFEDSFDRFRVSGFIVKVNGVGVDGRLIYEVRINPDVIVPVPINQRQMAVSFEPETLAGVLTVEDFVFDHKAGDGSVFYRRLSDNCVLRCLTGFAPFEMEEPVAPTEPRPKPSTTFKLTHRVFLKSDEARALVSMMAGETIPEVRLEKDRRGEVIGVLSDNDVVNDLLGRESFETLRLFVPANQGTVWRINSCVAEMCWFTKFEDWRHQPRVLELKRKPPEVSDCDHWLRDIAAIAGVPVPAPLSVCCVESPPEKGPVEDVPVPPVATVVADTTPTVSIVREVFVSPTEAVRLLEAFRNPTQTISKFERWIGNKSLVWKLCNWSIFSNVGGKGSSASYLPNMSEVVVTRFKPYGSEKISFGRPARFRAMSGVTAPADQWLRDLEAIVATSSQTLCLPPPDPLCSPPPDPLLGKEGEGVQAEAGVVQGSRFAVLSNEDLHLLEASTRSAIREAQELLEAIEAECLRRAELELERARKFLALAERLETQRTIAEGLRRQAEEAAVAQAVIEAEIAALG